MTSPIRLASCAVLTVVLAPIACGSPPDVRTPKPETVLGAAEAEAVWTKAQHVFESRCVVCHGCYDAPCQLKLGTYEGIERGGTERQVYDGSRLIAAEPTRLGIDAHNRFDWRKKDFHPALPEGKETDPRASLLLRMLELKRKHPLASGTDVAKDFTLDLSRKQVCTDAKHFDAYAKEHPGWGMPYALPGVTAEDEKAIVDWVRAGAPHSGPAEHSDAVGRGIADWETFLNDGSPKGQLVGRYIYEHLFLASIRFEGAADGEDGARGSETPLYRLVRSRTESGRPIVEVATRRPFEDPKSARVYYRFERRIERALDKTHMPYPLSPRRLERYRALFFEAPYEVSRLPGYDAETASNPFRAFHAIPVSSRYRFMLEEAQFTLMGFIKGPVCRGQIALNVIEDRFWITFVDPEVAWQKDEADFLADVKEDLDMPAEAGSNALPTFWMNYEAAHARYMAKKAELFERVTKGGRGFTPSAIWDGDGKNPNAALTVFRHFDSATVVKGLVGGPPKTAWVIDYPLLERIHYLLVAGFDVFGNVGHQIKTRLYMDFLRMEGEAGFLALLPPARRRELVDRWYRGVKGETFERIARELVGRNDASSIPFKSKTSELEVFALLRERVGPAHEERWDLSRIGDAVVRTALAKLDAVHGSAASWMPESSFFTVVDETGDRINFTLLRDSAHTNVAHLLNEDQRRLPNEDELAVVPGFLGSYPNALFVVKKGAIAEAVEAILRLDGAPTYRALRERFGVLRASEGFWKHSDRMNRDHLRASPIDGGFFDYNRLEAF